MTQATCPLIPAKHEAGTTQTPETLTRQAHSLLDARGIPARNSKITRAVRGYLRRSSGSAATFEAWLLSALDVDVRVIPYRRDPTGEDAVNHVLRGASR